jgi:hypothetical protein
VQAEEELRAVPVAGYVEANALMGDVLAYLLEARAAPR